jgi:hypothetical protein
MTTEVNMTAFQVGALMLRRVAIFCLTHGGLLHRDWTGDKLFKYLAFQWLNGCLFIAREGEEIAGVMIVWPDGAADVLRRQEAGELHFAWLAPREGDALMVADVIVSKNFSTRQVMTRLVQMASARWPDWKMRRIFTHRRGKLVELAPRMLTRFFHGRTQHS